MIAATYFIDCISEADMDEMNIEIIRNTLYKVGQKFETWNKPIAGKCDLNVRRTLLDSSV